MKNILAIDDDPDVLEILSYNLKKAGYNISIASNGESGLQLANEKHPDLIILDVRMEGMTGIQVCDAIKHDSHLKNIPVLFLTGDQDELIALAASSAGGEHFLTKPIHPALIVSMIKELFEKALT